MPPGYKKPEEEDDAMPGLESTSPASSSKPAKTKAPEPVPEPAPEPAAADPDAAAKKTADEAKAAGNAAYKSRKFEEAIGHYQTAWSTYPKDITYLTNLAGEFYHLFHR